MESSEESSRKPGGEFGGGPGVFSEIAAASSFANVAESVKTGIAPFLTKHIPQQYSHLGTWQIQQEQEEIREAEREGTIVALPSLKTNTRFCYRHRPDVKCRRPVDEPTMEQLQSVGF
jgi:F-box/WD-40 domain protein MET30